MKNEILQLLTTGSKSVTDIYQHFKGSTRKEIDEAMAELIRENYAYYHSTGWFVNRLCPTLKVAREFPDSSLGRIRRADGTYYFTEYL